MNGRPPADGTTPLFETIDDHNVGQCIDNFLGKRLKGVPKQRLYRALRSGEVRVNKGRIRAGYKLCVGDVVRIPPLPRRADASPPRAPEKVTQLLRDCVLHEDEEVLVLNKPAGIPVHSGSGNPYGVIEALRASQPVGQFLELAHRLDRDTSGCLLLAKNRRSLTRLHTQLREGKIRKSYLVLVRGKWTGGNRRVSLALRKNRLVSGERMATTETLGKAAVTHFKLIGHSAMASLIEATIDTGRTHQIRVHAQSINFPVAGDSKYGDKAFNRLCRERGLTRMFLHSHRMTYRGEEDARTCNAPLGDELLSALHALGLGSCIASANL